MNIYSMIFQYFESTILRYRGRTGTEGRNYDSTSICSQYLSCLREEVPKDLLRCRFQSRRARAIWRVCRDGSNLGNRNLASVSLNHPKGSRSKMKEVPPS